MIKKVRIRLLVSLTQVRSKPAIVVVRGRFFTHLFHVNGLDDVEARVLPRLPSLVETAARS